MKVMALNLPRDFDENALAALFKAHGNIKSSVIVKDDKTGKSKGFGFVEMALAHEGEKAISALHGKMIGKKRIRVKAAH